MSNTNIVRKITMGILLKPIFIFSVGIVGSVLSMTLVLHLIKVNPNPTSIITINESGCKSEGVTYEIDGQFLSEDTLSVIVMYRSDPYRPNAAAGCRLEVIETIHSGSPINASIIPYGDIPSKYKEGTHLSCTKSNIRGSQKNSSVGTYIESADDTQPFISFCIKSENFKRSYGILAYMIQMTGSSDPYNAIDPTFGYRVKGNEWYSLVPTISNRSHFRINDESKTSAKQTWLFILAAVFGASVSAIFEATLAFGYQAVLEKTAKRLMQAKSDEDTGSNA